MINYYSGALRYCETLSFETRASGEITRMPSYLWCTSYSSQNVPSSHHVGTVPYALSSIRTGIEPSLSTVFLMYVFHLVFPETCSWNFQPCISSWVFAPIIETPVTKSLRSGSCSPMNSNNTPWEVLVGDLEKTITIFSSHCDCKSEFPLRVETDPPCLVDYLQSTQRKHSKPSRNLGFW